MTAERSYICQDCGYAWAYFHHPNEVDDPTPGCIECNSSNFTLGCGTMTLPVTIVKGNHDFVARQRERLTARSTEHYKRRGKDEALQRQDAHWKSEGIIK